jgi:hypothetical protein
VQPLQAAKSLALLLAPHLPLEAPEQASALVPALVFENSLDPFRYSFINLKLLCFFFI